MGRQLLTFVFVFVGIMLMMRMCSRAPESQGGIRVEAVTEPGEDAIVLRSEKSGAEVVLGPDGSVASISDGGAAVIRPVPSDRRPFHLFLGQTHEAARIPEDAWAREEVPDGGWKYSYGVDKLRIERTLRLAEDGHALVLSLKAEGVPQEAVGLVLTGASGVELAGEGNESPFAFTELVGGKPQIHALSGLRQQREDAGKQSYTTRDELTAEEHVKRFGLFGRGFCVALEDLPAVSKLFTDVYRADRGGAETDEVETWLDLVAGNGTYEGTFTLRWTPRADATALFPTAQMREGKTHVLEDATFQATLTERGAAIREMWLKTYSTVAGEEPSPTTWIPILGPGALEGERALTLFSDGHGVDPAHEVWDAAPSADGRSILFTLAAPDGWVFRKRFALPDAGRFDLGVEIEVVAPEGSTATQAVVSLVGPAASYIVDSYRGIIGAEQPATFILDRNDSRETKTIDDLKKGVLDRSYAEERRGRFLAIGTRGTYFVCALVSEDARNAVTGAIGKRIRLDQPQERAEGEPTYESMLGRVGITLALDGGRAKQSFRLYAGPNETSALRELNIGGSINFGWFGVIGRALMWLMKALHGLVGSYGVAIMMMTVIVRGLLLPISYRTQLSMQRYGKRLQKIKPILDEIQKKYAKDPQRMNQERMKAMREHGVGLPLGCLMMFFQIPIWFALFQALRVEFALRHQSFLWVLDLSMPDRAFHLPFWPDWLNVLPILMLVLWVIQQKFAPTTGNSDDPQVKMQMKMMRVMPFVFFFMLYKYAAALALYMCVSSCWTIAESKLVRRAIAKLG